MSRVRFTFEDDEQKTTRSSQKPATPVDADTLRQTSFLLDESEQSFHQQRGRRKLTMASSLEGFGSLSQDYARSPYIHGHSTTSRHSAGYFSDPDLGRWVRRGTDPVRSAYYKSYDVDHRASDFWRNKLLKRYMTSVMGPASITSML